MATNITTATTITPGTTVALWAGATTVERTVESVTEVVDRKTMEITMITISWTNGTCTNYLPDAEFTTI